MATRQNESLEEEILKLKEENELLKKENETLKKSGVKNREVSVQAVTISNAIAEDPRH